MQFATKPEMIWMDEVKQDPSLDATAKEAIGTEFEHVLSDAHQGQSDDPSHTLSG